MRPVNLVLWILGSALGPSRADDCDLSPTPKWDGTRETLFSDYFDLKLKFNPIIGSRRGFHEYDDRLPTQSIGCFQRLAESCLEYKRRAEAVLDNRDLEPLVELEVAYMAWEANMCHQGIQAEGYYFPPVHYVRGVQNFLVEQWVLNGLFHYETAEDLENPLRRLKALPKYLDDIMDTLRGGMVRNMTFARESFTKVQTQFEALQVDDPESSQFYVPFRNLPADSFDPEMVRAIQEEAKAVIMEQVLPAFNTLDQFIYKDYFPHLRPESGILSIPNGQSYYQRCLEFFTSIDGITADEVHAIGLEEVFELEKKVFQVMETYNQTNSTLQEFATFVRNQPGQTFETREALLDYVTDILANKINPKLKDILPASYLSEEVYNPNIASVPQGGGGSVYFLSGAVDGSSPGTFYINLDNLGGIKKFELMALTLHEANPGHNLDDVVKNNLDLPDFAAVPIYSRLSHGPSNFPFQTALNEGWGLYSEYLGLEMGLFEDPLDLIGYYSFNLLRAARLVVDTGIHSKGWTREQAVSYLAETTFFGSDWAENQVNRYITWPGQAVSYKMGERAILAMRKKFQAQLGDAFDVKEFHGHVLACQVPLPWLEKCLNLHYAQSDSAK